MEPWQSWAAAIVIGGAAFLYYSKDSKYFMKARESRTPSVSEQQPQVSTTRRRQDKPTPRKRDDNTPPSYAEAVKSDSTSASTGASKKRKAGRAPAPPAASTAPKDAPMQADDAEDDDVAHEDKEWAKQLNASKKGVSLNSSAAQGQQRGTKPQKQANGAVFDPQPPTKSSGRPNLANGTAQTSANAPAGGDVSDMLEPRAPGPSVIRVTGEVQEAKKLQASRPAQVQETKKQRQNRKKAEEKKLQREEDEKERQVLLENQRRAARQARGEPAKNGLAPSSAPKSSVWTAPAQSSGQPNGSSPVSVPAPITSETALLDTFDHDALSTSSSNDPHTDATTPATAASSYDQGLPSEEVQLEMLDQMNQDSGWNEVSTKGKKSKKKAPTSAQAPLSPTLSSSKESNQVSAASTNELVNGSAKPAPTVTKKSNPQTNGFAALDEATGYTPGVKGHPDDSDWAVF